MLPRVVGQPWKVQKNYYNPYSNPSPTENIRINANTTFVKTSPHLELDIPNEKLAGSDESFKMKKSERIQVRLKKTFSRCLKMTKTLPTRNITSDTAPSVCSARKEKKRKENTMQRFFKNSKVV